MNTFPAASKRAAGAFREAPRQGTRFSSSA